MRISLVWIPFLAILVITGCGSPVGEPCKLTSGALGFGFDDPCRTRCLELSSVICPDGSTVRKAVCAGREGCSPGSCGDGLACYAFEDPFEDRSYCIPADFCGADLTAEQRSAWERASRQRSDEMRKRYADRARRRAGGPTAKPPAVSGGADGDDAAGDAGHDGNPRTAPAALPGATDPDP